MVADGVGGLPCGWQIHSKDGSPMAEPPHPPLAVDRVRHVGDPVAVVIAETLAQAREAAEQIGVDYAEEPAVVDPARGAEAGRAAGLCRGAGQSLLRLAASAISPRSTPALPRPARVVRLDLINNRLVPNAMEPRAAIGEFDRATGDYTLFTTSQNPHVIRLLMGAFVLHIPEAKLRVVAPDVGGGFGSKIYHYAEEAIVTWAAGKIRRPVKWTAERSESFMSDAHGRDHVTHVELALDAQAKFLALKVSTIANMGGYLSTFAPCIPTYLYGTLLAGTYTTPAIYVETKAVFTHTVPVDAYRGAGRPEATFLLERIVDLAADEIGMDPAELRRRNFIPKDAYPYQTPVALQYDSGDYGTTLELALKAADYAGFEARRREALARGKMRGIGIATYIEACGIAPSAVVGSLGARAGLFESAAVRVHPTGSVSVLTGSHSHGQGHETTFSQLVADRLGIPIESIEIVHGDTAKIPYGMGTYGSRSLAVGGSAIVKAMDKVVAKGRKIAAHLLEAAEADIEFKDGKFTRRRHRPLQDLRRGRADRLCPAQLPARGTGAGARRDRVLRPEELHLPVGRAYRRGRDRPRNRPGLDRQLHRERRFRPHHQPDDRRRPSPWRACPGDRPGAARRLRLRQERPGQLLTGSYNDYAMPRADDLPYFALSTNTTLCTHNPLGVKGCGEAGAIGAPAAITNAIVDALKPLGVRHLDMPATPEKLWRVIQQHR